MTDDDAGLAQTVEVFNYFRGKYILEYNSLRENDMVPTNRAYTRSQSLYLTCIWVSAGLRSHLRERNTGVLSGCLIRVFVNFVLRGRKKTAREGWEEAECAKALPGTQSEGGYRQKASAVAENRKNYHRRPR